MPPRGRPRPPGHLPAKQRPPPTVTTRRGEPNGRQIHVVDVSAVAHHPDHAHRAECTPLPARGLDERRAADRVIPLARTTPACRAALLPWPSGHANPLQPTVQPGAASTTWALLRNLCARRDHRQRSGHLPRAFRSRRFGKSSSQTPILASQIVRYTLATQPSSRAQNDKRRAADRRYWLLYASNKRLTISSITGGRAHGPYAAV